MKKISLFLLFSSLFVLLSCKDDTIWEPPPPPTFEIMSAPELMLGNVDSLYEFKVRAQNYDPQPDSIRCVVYFDVNGAGPSVIADDIYLFDDGNSRTFSGPPYASPTSTDIVPNDGVYTRRINGRQLSVEIEGDYLFSFHAEGVAESLSTIAEIANIDDIIFSQLPTPQAFGECFDPVTLEIRLSRDPQDRVDSVVAFFHDATTPTENIYFVPSDGDTVWQFTLSPRTFPCILSYPLYGFDVTAYTHYGRNAFEHVAAFGFTNSPSVLSNSTLPDTIFRPVAVGDTDTVVVTVNLEDCDLEGVLANHVMWFDVAVNDTSNWQQNSQTFFLRDDGIDPDTVGGNGVYSVGLTFNRNDGFPDNEYYFRFYTICPERSDYLLDSVRVIQPSAITLPGSPASNELGFGVVR